LIFSGVFMNRLPPKRKRRRRRFEDNAMRDITPVRGKIEGRR